MEGKYHIVRTIPKSNRKIVDRGKIDTTNTHRSFCCLGTGTSIKSGGIKLVFVFDIMDLGL